LFKPRLKMVTPLRKSTRHKPPQKSYSMPKLITIGNSVGMVISKALLESIDWKKGDSIEYEYDDIEKRLVVRNLTAEQRDSNAVHKPHREDY